MGGRAAVAAAAPLLRLLRRRRPCGGVACSARVPRTYPDANSAMIGAKLQFCQGSDGTLDSFRDSAVGSDGTLGNFRHVWRKFPSVPAGAP